MFIFEHLGVTVGAVWVIQQAASYAKRSVLHRKPSYAGINNSSPSPSKASPNQPSRVKWLDYRFLALGSILPDMIDKTFGVVFLGNGRGFSHSLVLTLVLLAIGVLLYKMRKSPILVSISLAWFIHLWCDAMWLNQSSFLWPMLGWNLPTSNTNLAVWVKDIFFSLITKPYEYIPEIFCGVLCCFIVVNMLLHGKITGAIKHGMSTLYQGLNERAKQRLVSTEMRLGKPSWSDNHNTILVGTIEQSGGFQ